MSLNKMIEASKKVKKLLEPLTKNTPIKDISYFDIDDEGEFYLFDADWEIYEKKSQIPNYIDAVPALLLEEFPEPGFAVHTKTSQPIKNQDEWNSFRDLLQDKKGYDSGVLFIDRHEDKNNKKIYKKITFFTEMFEDEQDRMKFYLNNSEFLKQYFRYFSNEIRALQKEIPPLSINDPDNYYRFYKSLKRDYVENNIQIPGFLVKAEKSRGLTKREKEVVYWYLMGKTSEETGKILNLSPNTIEAHFYNIKSKLDIGKKSQICYELMKSNPEFFTENPPIRQ